MVLVPLLFAATYVFWMFVVSRNLWLFDFLILVMLIEWICLVIASYAVFTSIDPKNVERNVKKSSWGYASGCVVSTYHEFAVERSIVFKWRRVSYLFDVFMFSTNYTRYLPQATSTS